MVDHRRGGGRGDNWRGDGDYSEGGGKSVKSKGYKFKLGAVKTFFYKIVGGFEIRPYFINNNFCTDD
jgi:hypothetical protein